MKNKTPDLRYEKKFVISEKSIYEIEDLVKHHPKIFSEIFYKRRVNNIYLDSKDLRNYTENLAGNAKRIKIRIRWYGKLFGLLENPILELKIKENELGKKLSFPLKSFVVDKNFSLKLLQKVFLESNLPQWLIEKLKLYEPTLLNSYERKYFRSSDRKYRITLDNNLIFFKIRNENNSFIERLRDKETTILELKYSLKDFEKTKHITEYLPFRLGAYSKYIKGIDFLEVI